GIEMLSCPPRPCNRAMPAFHFIPSIDAFLQQPGLHAALLTHGREAVAGAARDAAIALRDAMTSGGTAPASPEAASAWMAAHVAASLADRLAPSLRRVINATGVIIHT